MSKKPTFSEKFVAEMKAKQEEIEKYKGPLEMNPILECVSGRGYLFQEDFYLEKFDFPHEEFSKYVNNLFRAREDEAITVDHSEFGIHVLPFDVDEHQFCLRLMIGQGSSLDLFTRDYYKDNFPQQYASII